VPCGRPTSRSSRRAAKHGAKCSYNAGCSAHSAVN
jgi:hypothetical protein